MGRIIVEKQTFSFEEIKTSIPPGITKDYLPAFQFCHHWLQGNTEFTLYTSGSTGVPKPITLTRAQMELSAKATGQALGLSKGNSALVCLNTSYIAGIMMLVRGMVLDLDLVLVAPVSFPLENIPENSSIDFAAFVPLQLQTMLTNPNAIEQLNQMKSIIVGGAPVTSELAKKIQVIKTPVYSTYGMTETVSHIALRKLNGEDREETFTVLPEVSISVDDRQCLRVSSPVTNHQWLQTNDVVEITAPNRFQWLGRADYTINSGGIKIQPETLERDLAKELFTLGITSFFIAGLPHPKLGEAVSLFVEGDHSEPLIREVIQKSGINRFYIPKAVIRVSTFARTPTGKIERSKIIDIFQGYFSGENQ